MFTLRYLLPYLTSETFPPLALLFWFLYTKQCNVVSKNGIHAEPDLLGSSDSVPAFSRQLIQNVSIKDNSKNLREFHTEKIQ